MLGDLGFLDVARAGGSPDSPPSLSLCADGASWSDPPSSRNSWRSRQRGEGAGMLWGWDLVASDPLSINPLGTGWREMPFSPFGGTQWVPG